jgi:hypothetical protein
MLHVIAGGQHDVFAWREGDLGFALLRQQVQSFLLLAIISRGVSI